MIRRGRRLEPDKLKRSMHIAAYVYQVQHIDKVSLNEARELVAEKLGTSVDTVKRAWRDCKNLKVAVASAALFLETELDASPSESGKRSSELRERVATIKRNRGKTI